MTAVCAVLLVAPSASAEPSPPRSADANAESGAETTVRFQRGVKLYSEEDYRAALVEFKRAYELSSNFVILYNVAQTQFQLREYADAVRSFEKYLRTRGARISASRREQVEKDIDDLRGRVAKVTIETSVPGAEITLDDTPLGTAPLDGPVDVSAGLRKLGATKEGYVAVSRSVELAGGDVTKIQLELVPLPVEPPPRVATTTPSRMTGPRPVRSTHPLVFVGYGLAAAGVVTGTLFGVVALGTKSDLDARCSGRTCPTSERGTGEALALQATASTIGFGAALVGAGVGTYFLLADRDAGASSRASAPPTISPWFAGTSAGLGGSF